MNEEDQPASLADQAAAWIPPWQRPAVPAAAPAGEPDDDADSEDGKDERDVRQPETDMSEPAHEDPRNVPEFAVPDPQDPDSFAEVTGLEAEQPADFAEVAGSEAEQPADFAEVAGSEAQGPDDFSGVALSETGGPDDFTDVVGVDRQGPDDFADVAGIDGELPDGLADVADEPEPSVPMDVVAAVGRTTVVAEVERPANLAGALEAILLVVDEPVSAEVLAAVLAVSVDEANVALQALASEYTEHERGFDLRRAAGGWRLYTRGEFASYVERFVLDGQSIRLTQAALETLAVIAYSQPVTRSRMSAIRGVNCDGVVRTLANRGLIEECGTQPDSGAFLYRTTDLFLEKLGLDSLVELPPLAPFLPDDVNGFADA